MSTLPTLALSVRQPWAWAIIHGGKDIENRSRAAWKHGLKAGLRIAIHAGKGMTEDEYVRAAAFMGGLGVGAPPARELQRGGIIGSVYVDTFVTKSKSHWFFGPVGLVLSDPQHCEFIPAVGQLGYFAWQPAGPDIVPAPAKWMLRAEPAPACPVSFDEFTEKLL